MELWKPDANAELMIRGRGANQITYPRIGEGPSRILEGFWKGSWKDSGRVTYSSVDDTTALDAFQKFSRCEGIIPALETAHAIAGAMKVAEKMDVEKNLVINVSGRGDKDVNEVIRLLKASKPG